MFDESRAQRIRVLLGDESNVAEKRMFGGLAFLVNGNMAVSASGQGGLLLRVAPADSDALLAQPHVKPALMRGRTMQGWLRVDDDGLRSDAQLDRLVTLGVAYARSLRAKR